MAVTLHVLAHPVGFFEVVTKVPTQSRSSHAHIFGIFLLLDVPVLEHLAIDEEAVFGQAKAHAIGFLAAGSYCPEVVSRRFLVLRVAGQTDMLGCVVTETAHTTLDQVVAILQVVCLEVGVLGVDIGQTAHLTCGTLQTIVVVANLIKTSGVIEVLVSTNGGIEFVTYACIVDGRMVGQNIDNNANAILASLFAELLEVLTGADHVVADLPIDRLVVIVPAALSEELRAAALVALGFGDALLGGRSLHDGIACLGDVGQVLANGVERPAPGVEYHFVISIDRLFLGIGSLKHCHTHRPKDDGHKKSVLHIISTISFDHYGYRADQPSFHEQDNPSYRKRQVLLDRYRHE